MGDALEFVPYHECIQASVTKAGYVAARLILRRGDLSSLQLWHKAYVIDNMANSNRLSAVRCRPENGIYWNHHHWQF